MQLLIVMSLIFSVQIFSADKVNAATSTELGAFASKFYGTPYKFGGTTPEGFDCSGYIRNVFNKFNISLPRTSAEQYNVGETVAKENLQPGDLVFFANT